MSTRRAFLQGALGLTAAGLLAPAASAAPSPARYLVASGSRIRFAGSAWQPLRPGCAGRDDHGSATGSLVAVPADARGWEADSPVRALDVHSRTGVASRARSMSLGFPVVCRDEWGCDENLGPDWPVEYSPLQVLTVHHSAIPLVGDPAANVRAIYQYHAEHNGWGDIGYHLLIDPAGVVYEGRYSGTDGVPVFGPDRRPVTAGHALNYNPGNIGICMLGSYSAADLSPAARTTLVTVLSSLCRRGKLNPAAPVGYRNPEDGSAKAVLGLNRHRDFNPTECPGNVLAGHFDQIRADVAAAFR
ncbi:N-acetylmuramoyl-L-alanine amidase [Pseudonocardiaceae bacterium YIM PH 21723]|nr:N-acetylmuramoyl-L-alanine amidase [Pseudonocardiaceae bacterium YIM PH 21723]